MMEENNMQTTEQLEQQSEQERPVDARELARQLGCAVSSVYRMRLPHIVIGGRSGALRFYVSEVRRELERRAQARQVVSGKSHDR